MADFKGLALQYVLADEATTRQHVTAKTADAIKNASVKSTAILNWVKSIDPWMPAALSDSESQGDNGEGPEPDLSVITRSKGTHPKAACASDVLNGSTNNHRHPV
ncbi:hypothetical protein MCOR25_005462 [Pyricularia grisea]|nr:hypothetical protein MCOR25_005462 [Pyricularia grisea]